MIVLDTHIWVWWVDDNPRLASILGSPRPYRLLKGSGERGWRGEKNRHVCHAVRQAGQNGDAAWESIAVRGESGYNLCQISAEVAVWLDVGTGIGVCGEG